MVLKIYDHANRSTCNHSSFIFDTSNVKRIGWRSGDGWSNEHRPRCPPRWRIRKGVRPWSSAHAHSPWAHRRRPCPCTKRWSLRTAAWHAHPCPRRGSPQPPVPPRPLSPRPGLWMQRRREPRHRRVRRWWHSPDKGAVVWHGVGHRARLHATYKGDRRLA
jgi:hypothetical protein